MDVKIKIDKDGFLPVRAHNTDAGLDIKSAESGLVPAHGYRTFRTGVHIQLPHGTAGVLVSKSGLYTKCGISSTGLIDEGFTGEIKVCLINNSEDGYEVQAGDKISQLVIIPVCYGDVVRVDELDGGTERGDNGFGSSGKR